MPIITLTETTALLGITASTYNSIISTLIPEVQQRVAEICNSTFQTGIIIQQTMTFDGSANSIIISSGSFLTNGFATGDDIYLSGSYRNDGYHLAGTVAATEMTIATATTVVTELSGASIIIAAVKWPRGIKPVVASMIKYDYETRPALSGKTSESIGDYSMSMANAGAYGYPEDLLAGLGYWKRPRFG